MADDDLSNQMRKTAGTMGKIIQKPPMSKKLLQRPPFRFLFDVVMELNNKHSFLEGLYTTEETANIKEKADKIAFLQKAIKATSIALGIKIDAKPSKIVAGIEPEKTNLWLQAMAKCITKKISTVVAVAQVLGQEQAAPSQAQPPPPQPTDNVDSGGGRTRSARPSKAAGDRKVPGDRKRPDADGDRATTSAQDEGEVQLQPPPLERPKSRGRHAPLSDDGSMASSTSGRERPSSARGQRQRSVGSASARAPPPPGPLEREGKDEENIATPRRAKHTSKFDADATEVPTESVDEPSAPANTDGGDGAESTTLKFADKEHREKSAGSKQRKHSAESMGSENADASSENGDMSSAVPKRSGAAHVHVTKTRKESGALETTENGDAAVAGVLAEGGDHAPDDLDDNDDDAFVVVDDPAPSPSRGRIGAGGAEDEQYEEHGALMRKIQDKKNADTAASATSATSSVNEVARLKEREAVSAEVTRLRTAIQTLCRSVNPLGKIVDYIHEDADAMHAEAARWQAEQAKGTSRLADELAQTEKELQPHRMKLSDLDKQIKDYEEMIKAARTHTHENDERIQKLLRGIALAANT